MRLEGSRFRPRLDDVVINWGNTNPPPMPRQALGQRAYRFLNEPEDIARVSNKLSFFQLLQEDNLGGIIPEWWQNAGEIPDDAFPVVCRTVLNGHSGCGIVIANSRDELVPAPLYTKYIKKNAEYRVHIGHGAILNDFEIIAVQQKRRNRDVPDDEVNWQVRNHQNGFIYARQDVEQPPAVTRAALTAFLASGLDFGAVDVIYNERSGRAFVLEINTAPGLEGTTLQDYTNFFNQFRRD
jgi:glutathione synthase/RimK-type ligase-like ATP-grasp enzyme